MDRFGRWSHGTEKGALTRQRRRSSPPLAFHDCVSTRTVEVTPGVSHPAAHSAGVPVRPLWRSVFGVKRTSSERRSNVAIDPYQKLSKVDEGLRSPPPGRFMRLSHIVKI